MRRAIAMMGLLAILATACSSQPKKPYTTGFDPLAEMPGGVVDGRGRFREIFCAIDADHGQVLPDFMPCDEALVRVGAEPPPSGRPVDLGHCRADFLVGLVPGLGWECIKGWLDHDNSGPRHVAQFGYEARLIEVDSLSGSAHNARQIRDFIESLPAADRDRPLILVGYSKGSPDLLEFLAEFPETAQRVAAVAGAVYGSQLVFHDQVIPGSTLMGFANADHWAMAVPVARQHAFAAHTFVSRNDYPREVLFEAVLRFIEEDLAVSPWGFSRPGRRPVQRRTPVPVPAVR
jgi:hypothetical protein